MLSVGIIGAGKMGTNLGRALLQKGYSLQGIASRTFAGAQKKAQTLQVRPFADLVELSSQSDIIIITTPDGVIAETALNIAQRGGFKEKQLVLHTSGAHSSRLLSPARKAGALTASMHPLQTFPGTGSGILDFKDVYFAVEGDKGALPQIKNLVKDLGGRLLQISTEKKPLYHAAACVTCNYLVTLIHQGMLMMEEAGVNRERAFSALEPLILKTLANIKEKGEIQSLSGPIERGDDETLLSHLDLLEAHLPSSLPFYKMLGLYTLELAKQKKSLHEEAESRMQKILEG